MTRILALLLVFIFTVTSAVTGTQTGKWGIAAPVFSSSGTEIALSKMATATTMYLFNMGIGFDLTSRETETGSGKADGPKSTSYSFDLMPEIRNYIRPKDKVSPYMGLFVLVGLGGQRTETPTIGMTVETISSDVSAGLGLSLGAEYFMSKHFSISAHARMLSYRFTISRTEAGTPKQTDTIRRHSFFGTISPALFIRFYY